MNPLAMEGDLSGAEVLVGTSVVGHVQGVVRDPVSQRVWRLVTRYGAAGGRQVAVPIEWFVHRGPRSVTLGVAARALDDLPDYDGATRTVRVRHAPAATAVVLAASPSGVPAAA